MADNYQGNDEYEFTDLDALEPETIDSDESQQSSTATKKKPSDIGQANVKRNALIAIAVIVVAMLGYKFLGSFFTSKPKAVDSGEPQVSTAPAVNTNTTPVQQQPVVVDQEPSIPTTTTTTPDTTTTTTTSTTEVTPASSDTSSATDPQVNQKLSALELSQQNLRSEVNSLSEQLGGVNTSITELTNKINSLNQMITSMAQKVEDQSNQITVLTVRTQPKKVVKQVVRQVVPRNIYYIQAVIPGRAWLIGTNGSTLTVREGTNIAGYGVVRLIDPHQGRIVTSSGQVIRFSPQDS
ncbi:type IVB secretion system protein IcmG/DotF [Legionella genomosp. 1]|uniref:type IVB secretion system protein IcmG/DotF n=1 Tax=Legionella genomosp. 1 TaxID=1093625 RepID=UPI001056349E|nr:type IVB secretion system protein IcmG/DotF [Legionella genomosp. 1]